MEELLKEYRDVYKRQGLLKKYDLVVLEDDKGFFLPYHAIPIVNNRVLEEFPEVCLLYTSSIWRDA